MTRLVRSEGVLDVLVTTGTMASAAVVVLIGGAGAIGWLSASPVLGASILLAAILLLAARRSPALGLELPSAGQLVAAATRRPWPVALATIAGIGLAWQLVVGLVLPPFAYDGITYHLTTVARWLQEGHLVHNDLSLCCARYPLNAELLFAWPMLLQGTDALVGIVQLPFAVLGALSVAGIARSVGMDRAAAVAAGAMFLTTPIVLAQASVPYVDLVVVAWALAALHGLLMFRRRPAVRRLVAPATAIGLVLGTKGIGPVWALVLGATLVVAIVAAVRARRLDRSSAARGLLLVGGLCLVLGSFWYVRNWVQVGNPVHPFRIKVAGATVFDGPLEVDEVLTKPPSGAGDPALVAVARSWAADLPFWRVRSYDFQERRGGLGPLWAWLAAPLLAAWAVRWVRRWEPAGLVVVVVVAVLALQPYRWWSRFTPQLAALGALAVVATATAGATKRWRLPVQALALVLAAVGVALSSHEVVPASRAEPLAAREVVSLIGAPASERSLGALFFPEYAFVDELPDDASVVVDLEAPAVRFVYPLFGRDLARTVTAAEPGPLPGSGWVVTARGRQLDVALRRDPRFRLAADVADVRVWAPVDPAVGVPRPGSSPSP